MMTTQEFSNLMRRVYRFRLLDNARRFACRAQGHMIVMGDCDDDGGWYWVGVISVTEQLNRAGYEYVR
jgi:hypothetical protein